MLPPPNCCIQVAPKHINRATHCFDTSHSRYPARRVWGSVVYFWRAASTNGDCSNRAISSPLARTRETLLSFSRGCLCNSGFEQLGELLGKHWPADIVSLRLVTSVSLEKCQLFLCFHALSNHPKLKASAQPDHCLHDDDFVGYGGDLTDERLVDLEGINGKLPEIAQAGVPRAEVIDRNLHASVSQCRENRCGGLGMLHQNAFGQLQFKKSRV